MRPSFDKIVERTLVFEGGNAGPAGEVAGFFDFVIFVLIS
jgi:hypothetical protein